MSKSAPCINDVLPTEILQKIFRQSTESFHDALHVSATCRLWRKLIFNPYLIERYWTFDDKHRRKGLVRWWNFGGGVNHQSYPFVNCSFTSCFLGQCASFICTEDNSEVVNVDESPIIIDRGSEYSLAFWLLIPEKGAEARCVFMVSDDDWDYARSAGVAIDGEDFLSIVFASSISERLLKSDVQLSANQWFHVALVQEREPDDETPRQTLWINGHHELTVEVPIAAFSSSAIVSFILGSQWNHCIADVSIWSRRLLPLEIRAIYEQKISIDKVNIAKFIFDHCNK